MSPEEFANEFGPEFPQHAPRTNAYGTTAQPVKPGMTKRGKVVVAVSAAILAGGGILIWQDSNADAKASEIQAQELALKQQELRVQELRELNKANAANQKAEETQSAEQQKQIKACVDADKGLIGKQLGVTYRSVTQDCQAQYGTNSSTGADMQEAASDSGTTDGGGISPALLLGIAGGGALIVGVAANRGRKSNAA